MFQLSCEQVTKTYIDRIKAVNPLLNAVVQDRFDLALLEAKDVDKFLETTDQTPEEILANKPLLGVPMTVKQSIAVKGMCFNAGSKVVDAAPATEDAKVIQLMKDAGAIALAITNTPEYCLCWETFNNITGTTKNPYDHRRTPGGSSGGEVSIVKNKLLNLVDVH